MADNKNMVTRKLALAIAIEVGRTDKLMSEVAAENGVSVDDVVDTLTKMHKSVSNAKRNSAPSKTTLENKKLIDEKIVPFVTANEPIKAKDIVASDEFPEVSTPQRAGALLGRAVAMGLISSNPYVEKGGKSYASNDYEWTK